ncbi:MAG: FAD-dependent oxidoreductase [Alphaproteobacteria bacterium]|nr:FAD-dependent oxidoreductase [Alphaproteobacteria bacterium]
MAPHPRYPHVFQPLRIGRHTLKNRIFVPAHTTNYGQHHLPSLRHRDYHAARAKGGAALIIFEAIRVHGNSLGRPQGVGGYDPACIAPFRAVADAVHAEGIPLFGQVIHLGRQINGDFERTVSFGPSAVRWSATAAMPHAMNRDDMDEVAAGHVQTAQNILAAGLDGFEVHLGHGHLLQQFLSPSSNCRDDDYGGTEERRLGFPLEVLRRVRDSVGADACMGIRISAEEFIDDGLHLDEMRRQLLRLMAAVQIDFVNVSHSAYHGSYSLATQMADMAFDVNLFRPLPQAIRRTLADAGHQVPVLAVCKFRTVAEAEEYIAQGGADMVGMARAHMADPELVAKAATGREAEQRPCIGCNQGCAAMLEKDLPITCLVNPRMGLEGRWPEPAPSPTPAPKKVLVIGGGPAGCEAAWVAAARGHRVALWEGAARLGGQVNAIRLMPHRADFLGLLDHQESQCRRHGVAVTLNRTADADAVAAFAPDTVVLATGSAPEPMVFPRGGTALSLVEALEDPGRLGNAVAVFDTVGEWSSMSLVEHLANAGKRVSLFCPVAAIGWRTTIYSNFALFRRLREHKVQLCPLRRVLARTNQGLVVEDVATGEEVTLPDFDSLIAVQYNRTQDELYAPLRARGLPVHMAGDCLAARTALEAVYEGHAAGLAL